MRLWQHARNLLTWEVAGPVVAYVLTAFLVGLVIDTFVARQQAVDSLSQARTNATRRIDTLQAQINQLEQQIATDARDRGRLEEAIQALAGQIRQQGGRPVVVVPASSSSSQAQPSPAPQRTPSPQPSPSQSPSPHPTPSQSPSPTPSPSRTCKVHVGPVCI